MASVSWSYPSDALITQKAEAAAVQAAAPVDTGIAVQDINFRYAITGDNPPWRPLRAFDDGHKVYIEFPGRIDQGEVPPLFVIGPDGDSELVNYRMRGNYYVVDRLFGAAELRLGQDKQQVVRISRTDGTPPKSGGLFAGETMSDSGNTQKSAADALNLRAAPRRVVRFKRNLLIGPPRSALLY